MHRWSQRNTHRNSTVNSLQQSQRKSSRDAEANIRQACIYINIILLYYVCHSIVYYVLVLLLRFSYYGYSSVWLRQRYYKNHTFIISTTTAGRWSAIVFKQEDCEFSNVSCIMCVHVCTYKQSVRLKCNGQSQYDVSWQKFTVI